MSTITPLMPGQPVPDLSLSLVGGGTWRLSERKPENFSMVVVYRGLHCPICKTYLRDLQDKLDAFNERGVEVLNFSTDDVDRATQSVADWEIDRLAVGYGISFEDCRRWGLFLTKGRGKTSAGVSELDIFVEPGLFLIRPDGTLFFQSIQTMPFARPKFDEVLSAIDYILKNDYPPRGAVIDHTKEG